MTVSRARKQLIKQIYKVDPLMGLPYGGSLRTIAFIEQPEFIERILTRLGLGPAPAHSPTVPSIAA